MWQQWVNFILAVWLVLSSFFNLTLAGLTTNVAIVGIVMAVLALWGALRHNSMHMHEHRHAM